jgi:hypothetical protein
MADAFWWVKNTEKRGRKKQERKKKVRDKSK